MDKASGDEQALDGWGFQDTRFVVQPDESVILTGNRYPLSGQKLPDLLPWFAAKLGAPLAYANQHPPGYPPEVPAPLENPELLAALGAKLRSDQLTQEPKLRLRHGHGHTGAEIWAIRYGKIPRVPDLVAYPENHDEVVTLVQLAEKYGACVLPYGGGTNVTEALRVPVDEKRFVIAVSLKRMNRILSLDRENRTARIEAGATGSDLLRELGKEGLTLGHEPDSLEFSTLGGWIATNASGMKKNRYGNIEELVLDVTCVARGGVVERPHVGPRESIGMNPMKLLFGSEGNLGIITSAVVKLMPLPEVQRYGSVLFPNLEAGFRFLYDLSESGAIPASVRLMDNTQFHFGQRLKARTRPGLPALKSAFETWLVTKVLGFDPERMTALTVVFEGTKEEVAFQEKILYRIAKKHGGMSGGTSNGERGYQLTFGIAYIRDLTFTHWAIAESFETSVPWDKALALYERVEARVTREHAALGLPGKVFFTGRFTQIYPTGVCIYFYLGFYAKGVDDPVRRYAELEHAARDEILKGGGTLSHHHGVGKLREDFSPEIYSDKARAWTREVKKALDPENLFCAGNHGATHPADES